MNRRPPPLPLLTRLTASLAATVVLLLTVLAVSPALHAWVHGETLASSATGHGHAHGHTCQHHPAEPAAPETCDVGCVVTLFAQGGSELAIAPALLAPVSLCLIATLSVATVPVAAKPAHTLPPGCGPPAV